MCRAKLGKKSERNNVFLFDTLLAWIFGKLSFNVRNLENTILFEDKK